MDTASEQRTDTVTTHRWGWLLFALILLGIGYLFSRVHAVKEEPGKVPLNIAADRLNIGEQWETKEFRWTLPIKNTTPNAIHVARFLSGCPCMTFDPPSLTLSPGQEVEVRITCDMTAKCGQNRDLPVRDYKMQIAPAGPDGQAMQRPWVLHGKVRSLLEVSARTVHFSDELIRGVPAQPRIVSIKPLVPITSISATAESATIHVELKEAGQAYELRIDPGIPQLAGPMRQKVWVTMCDSGGQRLPDQLILLEGVVTEPIVAVPDVIDFGAQKVGGSAEETIVFHSRTGLPFVVREVHCESSDIELRALPSRTGNEYVFILRQLIRANGKGSQRVEFVIDYHERESISLHLDVRCYGLK